MERAKLFIQRGLMCVGVLATSHFAAQKASADQWYREFNPIMIDQDRNVSPEPYQETGYQRVGAVSFYSRQGCIGCRGDLRMANGQPLNDAANTLAFNDIPLNRCVVVTNLENGISIVATVTDTGNYWRHNGRIADLTIGLMNNLGAVTDRTPIRIAAIENDCTTSTPDNLGAS